MFLVITFVSFVVLIICVSKWLYAALLRTKKHNQIPTGIKLFQYMVPSDELFLLDRETSKKYYPIFKLDSNIIRSVRIVQPEDMEIVLTSMKHITKSFVYDFLHDWLGTGLLTSTGGKWQNRRKILTPAFHFNILQEFLNIFNEETKNLVGDLMKICDKPYIDVVEPITQFTLFSIGETALGTKFNLDPGKYKAYKKAIHNFGEMLPYRAARPWFHLDFLFRFSPRYKEHKENVKLLHEFSNNVIADRKKSYKAGEKLSYSMKKKMAMLDLLLCARQEGVDIDDEGIREEVDTFMFEGHDTTSMAICHALLALANHKQIQEDVVKEIIDVIGDSTTTPTYNDLQEMKYLEIVLKEVLRLFPSVPLITRVAGEDFITHNGYTISKGVNLFLQIIDMHRNPNVYPDPEKFDPDRFLPENCRNRHPFAYLPFSAGPRNCIGQKFALLELKAVLCGILRNFILEPVDRPEDIVYLSDMVLRPKNGIKVKFLPRRATFSK